MGVMKKNGPEAKLLVVDDEPNIRELLSTSLRFAGFEVVSASNGREALAAADLHSPDLAVLDVMLPDMDGFTVTRRLRAAGKHFPVLFLTAKDDTEDKVMGLTVGGDDYVTKPFSLEELLARIRAVTRRVGAAEARAVVIGRHRVDLGGHTVVSTGGDPPHLTRTEWQLLEILAAHPGKLITQTSLLQRVWGPGYETQTHYLRQYMAHLRRKLEDDPARPRHLLTEPGMGYRLSP